MTSRGRQNRSLSCAQGSRVVCLQRQRSSHFCPSGLDAFTKATCSLYARLRILNRMLSLRMTLEKMKWTYLGTLRLVADARPHRGQWRVASRTRSCVPEPPMILFETGALKSMFRVSGMHPRPEPFFFFFSSSLSIIFSPIFEVPCKLLARASGRAQSQ